MAAPDRISDYFVVPRGCLNETCVLYRELRRCERNPKTGLVSEPNIDKCPFVGWCCCLHGLHGLTCYFRVFHAAFTFPSWICLSSLHA